jgi:diguanylate cyclase (GGDEF)-like protein
VAKPDEVVPAVTGASHSRRGLGSFEQAVSVVRLVLAVLTVVALLSAKVGAIGLEGESPILVVSVVVATAVGLSMVGLLGAWSNRLGTRWFTWFLQLIDTIAAVGLVYALADRSAETAWVLLVVPVVVASIRMNGFGVLVTWLLGSIGYILSTGIQPQRFDIGNQVLVEQLGVLLAVAGSVALLARWLQEGWQVQSEQTRAAEQASHRLLLVGEAARALRQVSSEEVLRRALAYVPGLGFDAATYSVAGAVMETSGQTDQLPRLAHLTAPAELGSVEVTRWFGRDGEVLYSVAVVESLTGNLVTGWSRDPVDDNMALALADLVAHASQALEAARHLEAAQLKATRDPLTALANRAELQRSLELVPDASDRLVAVIFIDLDDFKGVNDGHGHLIGDRLLVSIARRLRRLTGGYAMPVRYGGDEFVVLAAGPAASAVSRLAEEIRQELAAPHDLDGLSLICTASIGVAATPAVKVENLVRQADQAAYQAKRHGRNQVWICRGDESFRPVPSGTTALISDQSYRHEEVVSMPVP